MPKRRPSRARARGPTLARLADRYDLYERSVQEPECEVRFFDRVYRAAHGRRPLALREDFCGTFAVACEWVKTPGRTATAVDLDPEPLAWGRAHNLARLPPDARTRVRVLEADVRTRNEGAADVVAAQNFSFWVFRTRPELREYFEVARANLSAGGLLVLDAMGGGECYREHEPERRRLPGFTYSWEMARFDPITHDVVHHIHFAFRDGSRLDRAFTYHWRFWTLPEIRELLAEAGFERSTVYWEGTDARTGKGNGVWRAVRRATCDPSWICYVVAQR